jgi:hypothetical protein
MKSVDKKDFFIVKLWVNIPKFPKEQSIYQPKQYLHQLDLFQIIKQEPIQLSIF